MYKVTWTCPILNVKCKLIHISTMQWGLLHISIQDIYTNPGDRIYLLLRMLKLRQCLSLYPSAMFSEKKLTSKCWTGAICVVVIYHPRLLHSQPRFSQQALCKKATISTRYITTMLDTSRNVPFPDHNYRYWWPTLWLSPERQQGWSSKKQAISTGG